MHDHRLRPIGSLLLLALVACKTAPDADTGLPPELTACIRTDALDEPRACTVDDDCACGAHCSFRACTFDCRTNADCDDGDVCNDLGRCAEPGARVPPLQDTPRSQVDAEPPVVVVADPAVQTQSMPACQPWPMNAAIP